MHVVDPREDLGHEALGVVVAAVEVVAQVAWGDIRLSLRSTAHPLNTRLSVISGRCFAKVTIGFSPKVAVALELRAVLLPGHLQTWTLNYSDAPCVFV